MGVRSTARLRRVSIDHVYCSPAAAVWRDETRVSAGTESISGRELVDAIAPIVVTSLEGGMR